MRFRPLTLAIVGLAALLACCVPAEAVSFYAATYSTNHLFRIDSDTWVATDLGTVTVSATSTHPYALSMDYSPDGDLYMMRGRGSTSGRPASIFSLDPDTLTAKQLSSVFSTGIGSGTAGDSAMTFRSTDGKCYVLKVALSGRPIVVVDDSFSAMTGASVETHTQGSNPTYLGMEWYDDGTSDGQVYALNTGSSGIARLNTLSFPSPTGYTGAIFPPAPAANDFLASGYTTSGDLCIYDDTLYIMVASTTASKLYSYDLTDGAVSFLADYPQRFAALAAIPGTGTSAAAMPEPLTVVGGLMGLCGLGGYLRRRRGTA